MANSINFRELDHRIQQLSAKKNACEEQKEGYFRGGKMNQPV